MTGSPFSLMPYPKATTMQGTAIPRDTYGGLYVGTLGHDHNVTKYLMQSVPSQQLTSTPTTGEWWYGNAVILPNIALKDQTETEMFRNMNNFHEKQLGNNISL